MNNLKLFAIFFLLLTFLSQAMASGQNCKMMMVNNMANTQIMADMDHNLMAMDQGMMVHGMKQMSDGSDEDCCIDDCSCVMGACSFTVIVEDNISSDLQFIASVKIPLQNLLLNNLYSKSLYRPPILS
ncbi:hypothetical protein [Thalassotalea sp. ND16A]|uniref:hypothetical protein n=1 Tax=Thalassotalea sp. ND16A TaxID=1535422 RepID=UPI00051D4E1A|nr:hypothetical protein [Thalassotalea sp. ND16A]KGK00134.1 hypothetical protein ND16A_0325 [Thalassotalea sp. ND16A]